MSWLIASTVVRGSQRGESHGGVYLIDTEAGSLHKPVDWNAMDIDWSGRGRDRGLRGIAFHDGLVFIAASDELLVFDRRFNRVGSYRNRYLKHCHEISVHGGHVFLCSTAYDSIIGLNLETQIFDWGLTVVSEGAAFGLRRFDPKSADGPPMLNKLHLNNVYCDSLGMYISGMRTKAMLRFDGERLSVMSALPRGVHNARPFLDGVLFNDTQSDTLRFESPETRKAYRVPRYPEHKLTHSDRVDAETARQGFGRGLCVIDEDRVAAGSSPSTVTLYDLRELEPQTIVNLTMDVRNAVHSLAVWPYAWPAPPG